MRDRTEHGWRRWWPFVLLCVFALLRLNLNESISGVGATLASQGVACVLVAIVSFAVASVDSRKSIVSKRSLEAAFAGALLLCGPEAALFLQPTALTTSGIAISWALVPVVIAVASGAGSRAGLSYAAVWPGIVAAAGLLLVVPTPIVDDPLTDLAMVLIALLTGLGCVLLCRTDAEQREAQLPAVFAGAGAMFLVGVVFKAASMHQVPSLPRFRAVAYDMILVSLAVLAIRKLRPLQYSARFVLISLAALIEGEVLFRAMPTARVLAGYAALSIATIALLRNAGEREANELSIQKK